MSLSTMIRWKILDTHTCRLHHGTSACCSGNSNGGAALPHMHTGPGCVPSWLRHRGQSHSWGRGSLTPSLVDNAPVRVSEQIHFFNLFPVLEQPTWLVLGDARNAAELMAEPTSLLWVYRAPKPKREMLKSLLVLTDLSHGCCWGQTNFPCPERFHVHPTQTACKSHLWWHVSCISWQIPGIPSVSPGSRSHPEDSED